MDRSFLVFAAAKKALSRCAFGLSLMVPLFLSFHFDAGRSSIYLGHLKFHGNPGLFPRLLDTNTTRTAAYAAVDPNISALRALVSKPTLTANSAVKQLIIIKRDVGFCTIESPTIAPMSSIAAMTVLTIATAQATCFSR